MTQPVLFGPRVRCEPLRVEHTDGVVATFADPVSSRFLPHDLSDPVTVQESMRTRLGYAGPTALGHWAFLHEEKVIGVGHLRPSTELSNDLIEIGWSVDPNYGRRGLATEAAGLLTDYALGEGRVPAVWALIHVNNARSLALARRLGYAKVGLGEHYSGPHSIHVKLPEPARVASGRRCCRSGPHRR